MRSSRTGYATLFEPGGKAREADTFTCGHCQRIRHVKPFCDPADLGGLCKTCMTVICEICVGGGCDPFLKKIERQEKAYHARRWMEEGR